MDLLSDFIILSQDLVDKTFEISDKAEEHIYIHEESTMKWGCIKNFYKDPVAVKEFLLKFPVVPQNVTHSPGLQQHFPVPAMTAFSAVYDYLHSVLTRYKFPILEQHHPAWQTYCNTHWKDMEISAASMVPHTDMFNIAFNIWLTEDNPAGTEFYYYKGDNEHPAYFVEQFAQKEPFQCGKFSREVLNAEQDYNIKWNPEEIDTFFVDRGWHKYLTIEPEYNSCTFYPGLFFHKPEWDSRNYKDDLLRYSQVISYRAYQPTEWEMVWDNYKNLDEYRTT